jgi:cytochrome P450
LVAQFSESFSLLVICRQVGAPDEAIEHVRVAAAAMLRNMSMLQSEEEEIAGVRDEIKAQHYFKGLIDKYRAERSDTLLSAFINAKLPSGTEITDAQILMHVMLDLFFAGAETTAKAISSGIAMLAKDPALAARLEADLEGNLRTFIEEVLRQEPPATTLFRIARSDHPQGRVGRSAHGPPPIAIRASSHALKRSIWAGRTRLSIWRSDRAFMPASARRWPGANLPSPSRSCCHG